MTSRSRRHVYGKHGVAIDIDRDGDIDVVTGGKTGVFLAENLTAR